MASENGADQDEEGLPEGDVERHDVADDTPLASLPLISRRRPAGGPSPRPISLGLSGWVWVACGVALLAIWIVLFATGRPAPILDRIDATILDAIVSTRSDPLTG